MYNLGLYEIGGYGGKEVGSVEDRGGGPRFPVKAFAQMCLGQPSSTLRLESHVVDTLVLGSGVAEEGAPLGGGSEYGRSFGRDDVVAVKRAKREALEAICEFHGTQGWSAVDPIGMVSAEKPEIWQEVVWDWYDARF